MKPCVFCGRPADTAEHVLPCWLRSAVEADGQIAKNRVRTERGLRRQWAALAFDTAVNSVCRECNNGWMSRLEESAKPLLQPMIVGGPQHTFDPREQELLAKWAMKTGLMVSLTVGATKIPAAHFDYLFRSQRPPDNFRIWIARCSRGQPAVFYLFQPFHFEKRTSDGQTSRSDHYVFTLRLGELVLQGYGRDRPLPRFDIEHEPSHPFVTRIWPRRDQHVEWPPRETIGSDDLLTFAGRFSPGTSPTRFDLEPAG